jgi:hypothetical protein
MPEQGRLETLELPLCTGAFSRHRQLELVVDFLCHGPAYGSGQF